MYVIASASRAHASSSMWSVLNSAPRAADKAFQHVMKALTPAVGSTVRPGDADQGKLLRQRFAARKIVKRRYHLTLGQIAGGAKDDQRAGTARPRRDPAPPQSGYHCRTLRRAA